MRSILAALSGPATILGVLLLIFAAFTPSRYSLGFASAVQVSQVYSEAAFYALLGIGALLFAIVAFLGQIQVNAVPMPTPSSAPQNKPDTSLGERLGKL